MTFLRQSISSFKPFYVNVEYRFQSGRELGVESREDPIPGSLEEDVGCGVILIK